MTRIARWRCTEPLRLYLWAALGLTFVLAVVGGLLDSAVFAWVCVWMAFALPVAGAVEAARASVYSPAGVVRALREAHAGASADVHALLSDGGLK